MNTQVPADIHWALMQARRLLDWATQTFPGSQNANEHLYRALSYHIHCSSQAFPLLQNDHNRLVYDNLKLQAGNQKLNDKISALDRECETLQGEVDDGKKTLANHLRTVNDCMANNSHLKEELRKVIDRQKLAPSHDDLVRLEQELYNVREHLSAVKDSNEDITNELEGAREREAITNKLNNLIDGQTKDREIAQKTLEGEKGALEIGLKHTKAREDAANCKLEAAKRDLDITIAEVDCLATSNEDLSRRLCEQERAQIEAGIGLKAAEDRCRTPQDELSGATASLEDLKAQVEESDQARSWAVLEVSSLQKRLDDEVKTTTELASSMDQEKSESKAKLEEEQPKLTESQAQQDRLTSELADSNTTVQRLESELKAALVQVTAFEREKAELSPELALLKACEQHLRNELAEHDVATKLLHTESERLLKNIDVLKVEADTRDEEMTSLRRKIQQLESALESSHTQTATSEKEKIELREERDSAREELETALKVPLEHHSEETTRSEADRPKLTREFPLKTQPKAARPRTADTGTNKTPPPSNSDSPGPNLDKAKSDKAKEPANDTTAYAPDPAPSNKKHARAADCDDDQKDSKM